MNVEMLPGIKVVSNYKFLDNRGYFVELWNSEIPMRGSYRQLNCAFSTFGVLRGMHYQDQTKFVMPIVGKIFDVVLDPNTGKWFGIELDASKGLLIPPQYAHGYLVLSAEAIVQYVVDAPYDQSKEKLYRWDQYNIKWPTFITPILSKKDAQV
jgi:dTDP-4-dehydrorhamnose 3,5-epimerase